MNVFPMAKHRIFTTPFSKVHPLYVAKAERKKRTREEVDRVIGWLTGYDEAALRRQLAAEVDIETFFAQAPALNAKRFLLKGVICGVRIEEIEDPLMREIRHLDKLVDDLATGCPMEKILPA